MYFGVGGGWYCLLQVDFGVYIDSIAGCRGSCAQRYLVVILLHS